MVVLSTVICNKRGKILLARQYRPMSKLQIEEAVSNFPKMISSEQQHTFIEDDKFRYVYLPMEQLYLLLLTSKNSNIIEDIEIARLLYKLILRVTEDYGVNEKGVVKSAFELILAFDDVITIGGYRESVSLSHIGSYLQMDSQDQKAHIQARKEQEDEAKATTNEKLKAIIQREKEEELRKLAQGGAGSISSGTTSGSSKFLRSVQQESQMQTSADDFIPKPQEPVRTGGLSLGRGGIQLKKKQQEQNEYFEPMFQFAAQEAQEQKFVQAKQEPDTLLKMNIDLSVEEKLSFSVAKDGQIQKLELKGTLYLTVNNPKYAASLIQLSKAKHPKSKTQLQKKGLKIKASPDMDRGRWEESKSLSPEEGQKFPVGQKIPALTYRYSSTDQSAMPFLLSVWQSGNKQQLTLELEPNDSPLLAYQPFSKVDFALPLKQGRPEVLNAKNAQFATGEETLILRAKDWSSKGALMKLKCHNSSLLFPIEISSEENWSVLGWKVNSARSVQGEEPSISFKSVFSIDNSHITN